MDFWTGFWLVISFIVIFAVLFLVGWLFSWIFHSYWIGVGIAVVLGVLFFIWLVKSSEKDEKRKKEEAEQAKKRAKDQANEALNDAVARGDEDAKFKALVALYKINPIAQETAKHFAWCFVWDLEGHYKEGGWHKTTKVCEFHGEIYPIYSDDDSKDVYRIFSTIRCEDLINFNTRNLRPLPRDEAKAFVQAVAECACDMIKEEFQNPKLCKNVTNYQLKLTRNETRCGVKITYTAPNGNYQPPAEW